jgi:hypothetical protein
MVDHMVFEAHVVTRSVIALRNELSPKGIRSSIFKEDAHSLPFEPEVRESVR